MSATKVSIWLPQTKKRIALDISDNGVSVDTSQVSFDQTLPKNENLIWSTGPGLIFEFRNERYFYELYKQDMLYGRRFIDVFS